MQRMQRYSTPFSASKYAATVDVSLHRILLLMLCFWFYHLAKFLGVSGSAQSLHERLWNKQEGNAPDVVILGKTWNTATDEEENGCLQLKSGKMDRN